MKHLPCTPVREAGTFVAKDSGSLRLARMVVAMARKHYGLSQLQSKMIADRVRDGESTDSVATEFGISSGQAFHISHHYYAGDRATARKAVSRLPSPRFSSGDFTGEIEMRWQDIENEKEKYAAYLCSREWAEKREAVRERSYDKCERCFMMPMEACHHLTYERKYKEEIEDLQAICNGCHAFTHGKSDFNPATDLVAAPSFVGDEGCLTMRCPRCGGAAIKQSHNQSFIKSSGLSLKVFFDCGCGVSFQMLVAHINAQLHFAIRFIHPTGTMPQDS